jgi:hypothetical protein
MEDVGIFMDIGPFHGLLEFFYGHWVYFLVILVYFSRFSTKKNLATLVLSTFETVFSARKSK